MTVPRIYIETSVISYLSSRPSRDLILAARQEATREWWQLRQHEYQPFISPLVLREAARGDIEAARLRLHICQPLALLPIDSACQQLAQKLLQAKGVPETEPEDALHLAVATCAGVDFIATWNFAHLVGPVAKFRLQTLIQNMGYSPPLLATPEELLEIL